VNGTVAFSRILLDQEIVVVANTDSNNPVALDVIVDAALNQAGDQYRVLYSNKPQPQAPAAVQQKTAGSVTVHEVDGSTGTGPLKSVRVSLAALEVQILGR
jgi:hypothetical protein